MQIELALGELGHLRWAAGDGEARDRMLAQIFQEAADKIAHLDQRMIGQAIKRADRGLGGLAGRGADVSATAGARDIHATVDRVDPGRARIGNDDAGRAQDRQAADDAEPPVRGALGDPLAAGHRDFDNRRRRRRRVLAATSSRLARIIARGAGLIAGSPGCNGRPGRVYRANPFAGLESKARASRREAHSRYDQRPMRDVRIVACVLDDAGAGEIVA